jgi:hypothetical protein
LELAYWRTTNGVGFFYDLPVVGASIPFSVGARTHW